MWKRDEQIFRQTNRLIFGRLERRFFSDDLSVETNKSTTVRHKFTSDGQMVDDLSDQTICSSSSVKNGQNSRKNQKSRLCDTIDDWYINNLAKNQVSAVFHSRVICRSVSPKFIELCMETPCLCPSEGHKHGGLKVTETSVTEFCYWKEKLLL